MELSAEVTIELDFQRKVFQLDFVGQLSIIKLGTVGATAGRFVLDTSGTMSDMPQFWGVATLETDFPQLREFGIFLFGKGTLQINPEPMKLVSIIEEVVDARRHDAIEKRQTLSLEIEGELPLIMADRRRMRDVVNNIIDNAIKYTQEGGKIQVGARDEGKTVHAWVKDNGIGIPLENLGRIFDTFHIVASDDLSHEVNRIGLSLAISKGIVESHGGRMWVESQVGKGSVFHIGMPKELPK